MKKKILIGLLSAVLIVTPGCVVLEKVGVNDWLNKEERTPDKSKPEMVTIDVLPLTNAVPIR